MANESLNEKLEGIDQFLEAMRDGAYSVTDSVMEAASEHLADLRGITDPRNQPCEIPVVDNKALENISLFCGVSLHQCIAVIGAYNSLRSPKPEFKDEYPCSICPGDPDPNMRQPEPVSVSLDRCLNAYLNANSAGHSPKGIVAIILKVAGVKYVP